jgi:hypothetical protein
VQPITSGSKSTRSKSASSKKLDKATGIYQLDRSLLNDGRAEIFQVWQKQQSRELLRSA